ncbi:MAG: flagellar protein FlaG [Synergistaceae bacterium]|jgi:hypothetical protein|nr:flagellar protein FlaG [Synergistaceae bacterium]
MEIRLLSSRESVILPVIFKNPRSGAPPGYDIATTAHKAETAVLIDAPKAPEEKAAFDRELKFEVREEAGVVQLQVIDARDGRVVRKVPADEVLKFIETMKKKIYDRVDVRV